MAEQIISPGVFTRENDQSFLPQGVGAIGAAIVGPTVKGPAFVPTVVRSFAEYERKFGSLSSETFVPQTVREYLRNAGSVTVTRVLGGSGYTFTAGTNDVLALVATGSADSTSATILGVIFPSKDTDALPSLLSSTLTAATTLEDTFSLTLNGSNVTSTTFANASIDPANTAYIFKSLGNSPDNSKSSNVAYDGTPGYTYINFKTLQTSFLATDSVSGYPAFGSGSALQLVSQSSNLVFSGLGQTEGYSYASTPFIQSGLGNGSKQLFKFHTLAHGTSTNKEYKISIDGLREPADIDGQEQYSSFNVLVRRYDDTDKTPIILEQFNGVTLDPDSPTYISRVIGDRYPQYNDTLGKVELLGNYSNISDFIRVEVDTAVDAKSTSPKLSPKGFAAVINPIATASLGINASFPSASLEGTQVVGTTYNTKAFLGWKFEEKSFDNENFIKPLPTVLESNVAGAFNVDNFSGHADSGLWTSSLSASLDSTGADRTNS